MVVGVNPDLLAKVSALPSNQRAKILRLSVPRIVPQYMKHVPHPKQQIFLSLNRKEVLYGGAAGGGKKMILDAKVLTPKGWRRNGDLVVGDVVVDPRTGGSQTVLLAHPVTNETVWEVEFEDGTVVEVCGEHLWTVRMSGKRTKGWESRIENGHTDPWLNGYKVVTTEVLHEAVQRARRQIKSGHRPNYPHTPVPFPVKFTRPYRNIDASLPVDPYILGVVLGDGWVNEQSVSVCGIDDEVHAAFQRWAIAFDGNLGRYFPKDRYPNFSISKLHDKSAVQKFKDLDLVGKRSWEKHIPEQYLFAPIDWRYKLMRGLMDTDGTVGADGRLSYTTVSEAMADDVAALARSLGAKVIVSTRVPAFTHGGVKKQGRLAYTVNITPHDPQGFVGLKRKHERLAKRQNLPAREVVDVRRTDRVAPMRCITVDGVDGLYITDDFVVTHNSDSLLMAALQYVDIPGYSALILRRTWPDLNSAGAILDRARTWLTGTDAVAHDGGRWWSFPSGSRLSFGYMQHDKDKYKYQSAEYQYIAFDELTQFPLSQYTYLFSRLRKPQLPCLSCGTPVKFYPVGKHWKHTTKEGQRKCTNIFPDPKMLDQFRPAPDGMSLWDVPLRMYSASNPGGTGHEWVYDRFIDPDTCEPGAVFLPALLKDNPSLNQEEYEESLNHLTVLDRERLLNGDWSVLEQGSIFHRSWFDSIDNGPSDRAVRRCRYWDMAASEGTGDYTVGTLVAFLNGQFIVEHQVRGQWGPAETEKIVRQTALQDGQYVMIRMEQEGGSSGKSLIDHYRRNILPGFNFDGDRPTGSKVARATPYAVAAENGNVKLVHGEWNKRFLDELELFPKGQHDDQVDSFSGACTVLALPGRRTRLIV